MLVDRPQAIVTCVPATGFHTAFAWGQIQLIMKYSNVGGRQFVEPHHLTHRLTRQVHEGLGLGQQDFLAAQNTVAQAALKLAAPG